MVKTVISVDLKKSPKEQLVLHNRWHPNIPPVANVKEGETFRVECIDWTGGQIKNNDSAEDIKNIDLTVCHHLSGPVRVEGAEPGDCLEVEILDIQPLPNEDWGYTGIFDINNGGGFLCDYYPNASKAIWDFDGIYASSRHIRGVKFAGLIHPGLIGTAPSQELLEEWNRRERELINEQPDRVPPLALPPCLEGALVGTLEGTNQENKVKLEAARTIPPREHGGNCDIKNLSRGSKVWFPVYIEGANLSMGDIHFSQGDGEIAFCGGIEMAGALTLRCRIIKDGMKKHAMKNPIFLPGPVEPRYSRYLTFEGISVDENGKQHYMDSTLAYKQAVLNCIEYFKKFGYSGEQLVMLLSCMPCEGRINSIVDIPNACCTIGIPAEIFDFDIMPKPEGLEYSNKGSCANAN